MSRGVALQRVNFTRQDVLLVKRLILECIRKHMTKKQTIDFLERDGHVDPRFTLIVWDQLAEENRGFFQQLYPRLIKLDLLQTCKLMAQQQVKLMWQMHSNEGSSGNTFHKRPRPASNMHQQMASSFPGVTNHGFSSENEVSPTWSQYHNTLPASNLRQSASPSSYIHNSHNTGLSPSIDQFIASAEPGIYGNNGNSFNNDHNTRLLSSGHQNAPGGYSYDNNVSSFINNGGHQNAPGGYSYGKNDSYLLHNVHNARLAPSTQQSIANAEASIYGNNGSVSLHNVHNARLTPSTHQSIPNAEPSIFGNTGHNSGVGLKDLYGFGSSSSCNALNSHQPTASCFPGVSADGRSSSTMHLDSDFPGLQMTTGNQAASITHFLQSRLPIQNSNENQIGERYFTSNSRYIFGNRTNEDAAVASTPDGDSADSRHGNGNSSGNGNGSGLTSPNNI